MYNTNKLIKMRKENKITLKEMAKVLNTSVAYYHMLETRKRKLHYDEAIKTKEKYNYDINIIKVDTFDEAVEYLKNN